MIRKSAWIGAMVAGAIAGSMIVKATESSDDHQQAKDAAQSAAAPEPKMATYSWAAASCVGRAR